MLIGAHAKEAPHPDIVAGSSARFQDEVIEASRERPVIVEFHAGTGAGVDALVREAGGRVGLVRIDVRRDDDVAARLRIQSLPAVTIFFERRFITGFTGAAPRDVVAGFLADLLGGADDGRIDALFAAAQEALTQRNLAGAAQAYAQIIQMRPNDAEAIAGLARCQLLSGNPARAKDVLTMLGEDQAETPPVRAIRAALALADDASDAPSLGEAKKAAARRPEDPETLFELARSQLREGRMHDAIETLLSCVAADRAWRDEAARKMLIRTFEALGPTAAETVAGRKRLAAILFS